MFSPRTVIQQDDVQTLKRLGQIAGSHRMSGVWFLPDATALSDHPYTPIQIDTSDCDVLVGKALCQSRINQAWTNAQIVGSRSKQSPNLGCSGLETASSGARAE